jgi:hypothetical protein
MKQVEGQVGMFDLDSAFGKTFPEPCQATAAKTSESYLKSSAESKTPRLQYLDLTRADGILPVKSWETVTALPGESWTLNIGESPSVAVESHLWQILQMNAPEKYYLSVKACEGILRRAGRRGKELPPMLKEALEEVVSMGQ